MHLDDDDTKSNAIKEVSILKSNFLLPPGSFRLGTELNMQYAIHLGIWMARQSKLVILVS